MNEGWGYFCVECLVSEQELGRRLFTRRFNRTKKIVGLICEHCNWERARYRDVGQEQS